MRNGRPQVAIVDYGMGNLFSVKQACAWAGLEPIITGDPERVLGADAVILPGVGAFGNAMAVLIQRGLDSALRTIAASGTPLVGICLGMQLLMTESFEFGRHTGLGIIEGDVVRLSDASAGGRVLKVPQVGWNRIYATRRGEAGRGEDTSGWRDALLEGLDDGVYMYFVHSYYARPASPDVAIGATRYGSLEFCSALRSGNVWACQFHPERSGPQGLHIYTRLAASMAQRRTAEHA